MINSSSRLFVIVHKYHRSIQAVRNVTLLLIGVFLGINYRLLLATLCQNIAVVQFTQFSVSHQASAIQQQTTCEESLLSPVESLLRLAVAQKVNSAPVFRLLGHVYSVQGDWERAEEQYLQALQASPQDTITYLFLGNVYDARGRPGEAILAWRQAKAARYFLNQVTARRLAGDLAGALEMYHLVLQLDPSLVPTDLRVEVAGIYYYSLGQKGEAEREFLAAVQQSVKDGRDKQALAYGELGIYYAREEHCDEKAVQALQQAVALTPDAANYRLWLGWCYKEIGLLDQAEEELLRASATSNIYIRGTAYLRLGETYGLARDWEKAIRAFNMAVELLPGSIEARTYLARAYQEAGQLDNALHAYQSLLEIYPDNEELRARYNELWMQLHK